MGLVNVVGGPTFIVPEGETESNEVLMTEVAGDSEWIMLYIPVLTLGDEDAPITFKIQANRAYRDGDTYDAWLDVGKVADDMTIDALSFSATGAVAIKTGWVCGVRLKLVTSAAIDTGKELVVPTSKLATIS
jgi:hypothetical protein